MSATTKVPISVFDTSNNKVAIINAYESASFERDWQGAGQFQITLNANVSGASELVRSRTVVFGADYKRFGIITQIVKNIGQEGKGSEKLSVSGYELKKILDWRMVSPLTGNDYFVYNVAAETVMHNLVKYNADPATVGATRGFTLLSRETDAGTGSTYLLSARWATTVLQELEQCSLATGHGCWIEFYPTGALTFTWLFRTAEGIDRRASQSTNGRIIFATAYGTLKSASLTDSDIAYKSLVYIGGQGVGQYRNIRAAYVGGVEPSNILRRELFVDARDLSANTDLDARAALKLAASAYTLFLDATALAASQFVYGTDYNLGDLVTISQFGTSIDARITKVKEMWTANNYDILLTFDRKYPELPTQVKANQAVQSAEQSNVEAIRAAPYGWFFN